MHTNAYKQEFGKGKDRFTVAVDYDDEKIYIHAPLQMSRSYPLDEYDEFEGNMEAFGRSKLDES
jgi:hypothetical protein